MKWPKGHFFYQMITKENIQFLKSLAQHNDREWFESHKSEFVLYQEEFKLFHQQLLDLMNKHDQIEKGKVFRIYRDVRFSKDKRPYKTYWSGTFKRATAQLRGGYYYQIEPGNSFVAGGFFGPESQDLLHIRKQISQDPDPLVSVLSSASFKEYFGLLEGEKVKTTPKGFSSEDSAIDLIRMKQFLVYRHFSDEEVLHKDFNLKINESFQAMRPYFDVMSMYLTTDLNGLPLI